jgi:hypothetical protein
VDDISDEGKKKFATNSKKCDFNAWKLSRI